MLLLDILAGSVRIRKDDGGWPADLLLENSLIGERVSDGGRDLVSLREGVRPPMDCAVLSWSAKTVGDELRQVLCRKLASRLSELLRRRGG